MNSTRIRLSTPDDFQFGQRRETRVFSGSFKLPNDLLIQRGKKKKKKTAIIENSPHASPTYKKRSPLFQTTFRETKKNAFINLFLRKLRQGIVRNSDPFNFFDISYEEESMHYLKTFKWNYSVEIIYSFFMILLTIIACIVTSLGVTFEEINATYEIKIVSASVVIFGLLEILFRIFSRSSIDVTRSSDSCLLVRDAGMNYLKGWFVIDLLIVVIFAIDLLGSIEVIRSLKFLMFLKLSPMNEKMQNLEIILLKNVFKEQVWELVKVLIFNFIFAHFLAIILILMTSNSQSSWLTEKNLAHEVWYNQYIWAYYWATTIMLTVGFGDIVPVSTNEALVMIFIQTLSCVVLAYNINKIGNIIKKITSYEAEKISNLKIFTQMQIKSEVSDDVQKKITDYITQSSELRRNFNIDEEHELLAKLPKTYYEQLKKQSTIKIFANLPFFRNLSTSKLHEISLKIDKKLAHPEEILIECNKVPEIIIANNGRISLSMSRPGLKKHGKQIQTIKLESSQFKILSMYFFVNRSINYDVKCKENTIIYSLSRVDLESLLSTNPYCYEYYCMVKDKDMFNSNDLETQICSICEHKAYHTLFHCPKLHYIPMKSMVVLKTLKNQPFKIKPLLKNQRRRISRPIIQTLREYSFADEQTHKKQSFEKCLQKYNQSVLKQQLLSEQTFACFTQNQQSLKSKNDTFKDPIFFSFAESFLTFGEKIKELPYQIMPAGSTEAEQDAAHDFLFYFSSDNPSRIMNSNRRAKKMTSNS